MCDCIPPVVQIFEFSFSVFAFRVMFIKLIPEFDAQKPEIRPEAARLRIPAIELAALDESGMDQMPNQCVRIDESHQLSHALGVQIAAESLKL